MHLLYGRPRSPERQSLMLVAVDTFFFQTLNWGGALGLELLDVFRPFKDKSDLN